MLIFVLQDFTSTSFGQIHSHYLGIHTLVLYIWKTFVQNF
jgi:hypothetical protein